MILSAVLLTGCTSAVDVPSSGDGESASTGEGSTSSSTAGPDSLGGSTGTTTAGEVTSGGAETTTTTGEPSSTTQGASASGEEGCAPVDVLLLVDNSGSMAEEQQRLRADLNLLAEGLAPFDPHVMVIDSDAFAAESCEEGCNSDCYDEEGVCNLLDSACLFTCATADLCTDYACGAEPDVCDTEFGAGVVDPIGPDSAGPCNFATGLRYFDASEPDFTATLECAASIGTASTTATEQVGNALATAVSASEPTVSCNAGFLRSDASLAVLFITDEADEEGLDSTGTPAGWYQTLLSTKEGDADRLVAAGIIAGTRPTPGCMRNEKAIQPTPRLEEFLGEFGSRGLQGDVCGPSYAQTLEGLVGLIEASACR